MDGRNIRKHFNALIREAQGTADFFKKAEKFLTDNGFTIWINFHLIEDNIFGILIEVDEPYYSLGYLSDPLDYKTIKIYSITKAELNRKLRKAKIAKFLSYEDSDDNNEQ